MNYFDQLKNSTDTVEAGEAKSPSGEGGNPISLQREQGRIARRNVVLDIAPPVKKSRPDVMPRKSASVSPEASKYLENQGPPAGEKDKSTLKRTDAEKDAPPEEEKLLVRAWEPESLRRRRLKGKVITWAALAGIAAIFITSTFLLPKFSIAVIPKAETVALGRFPVGADTAITKPNLELSRVPGIIVSVEKTLEQNYETSGKKFIEEKARGQIAIFNAYSSSPQTLAASTRFQDSNGKVFRLISELVIPGAKIVEGKIVPTSIGAELRADSSGEEYNIGPTDLKVIGFRGSPKYDGFYAKADSGFTGGFRGEARVITAEDLKRSSEDLTRRAFDELKNELNSKVPSGADFVSPEGGREITIVKIEQPKAGERFDRFPTSVTAAGRLAAVRRTHVNEVIAAKAIPKNSELAVNFTQRQSKLVFDGARFGPKENEVSFSAGGEFIYWRETNLNELKSVLQNSTPEKAEAYLRARSEVDSFSAKKFPRWLWYIPAREGGFEIKIQPLT